MYHIFFICPSVNEHLGCFCVFAVANNAAVNIEVCVSFSISRKPPVFKCIHLQDYFKSPQILCENEWKREREKEERRKKEEREEEREKVLKLRDVSEASRGWVLGLNPLGWTGWISLQSKGLSRVFSVQKHQFFGFIKPLLPFLSQCMTFQVLHPSDFCFFSSFLLFKKKSFGCTMWHVGS